MNKPSTDDIKSAIDQSGYVLELRICPLFEEAGFIVDSSAQFEDQDTGKSRELDLHAWSFDFHNNRDHPNEFLSLHDSVFTDVIVECKANGLPLVFFSRKAQHPRIGTLLFDGNPPMIREYDEDHKEELSWPLTQEFDFESFHQNWNVEFRAHKFARLESKVHNRGSKTTERTEWRLSHSGLGDAIEKLCKASMARAAERKDCSQMGVDGICEYSFFAVYPLMVCSGDIYECRVSGQHYELIPTDHVQLDWSMRSSSFREHFRIHVVQESALSNFLSRIKNDHEDLRNKLDINRDRIYQSVKSYNLRDGEQAQTLNP